MRKPIGLQKSLMSRVSQLYTNLQWGTCEQWWSTRHWPNGDRIGRQEPSQRRCRTSSTHQGKSVSATWTCPVGTRLRLGHSSTPAHLFRIGVVDSPDCPCGEAVGTAEHIILRCGAAAAARGGLWDAIHSEGIACPPTLVGILVQAKPRIVKAILEFLDQTSWRL